MPRGYSSKEDQKNAEDAIFAAAQELFGNAKYGHTVGGGRYTVVDLPSGKTLVIRSERDLDTMRAAQALTAS